MKRKFLFLQGNSSHFFLTLGRALASRGYGVKRINMCGGDRFFWGDWNAVDYRGKRDEFGAFVGQMISSENISDIVLHNDCRPGHRQAIHEARNLGCRIWVFEEGYMRPHWLTLEEGGINGNSPLPREADRFLGAMGQEDGPANAYVALQSGMRRRVVYDFQWQIWNYLLWFRYPRFRTHRPFPIWAEYATWLKRLAVLPFRHRHADRTVSRLRKTGEEFFIFPMQLDSDSQVRLHSPFANMTEALDTVIGSFAAHAPDNARLVVKAHPLDNGWTNFRRRTRALARQYKLQDRVDFIDGGDLNALIACAQGVVTLNSTVGLTALELGCPVVCLGNAIFDIPGLTCQEGLDDFWMCRRNPDSNLFEAFRRRLFRESLVNGDYYTAQGIELAVTNSIARFEANGERGPLRSIQSEHAAMPSAKRAKGRRVAGGGRSDDMQAGKKREASTGSLT